MPYRSILKQIETVLMFICRVLVCVSLARLDLSQVFQFKLGKKNNFAKIGGNKQRHRKEALSSFHLHGDNKEFGQNKIELNYLEQRNIKTVLEEIIKSENHLVQHNGNSTKESTAE